jgi:hypothetical protein
MGVRRGKGSPVTQHAHFVGATTFDPDWTLTFNLEHIGPGLPARWATTHRNDGVEDVTAVTLIEHHGLKRYPFRAD